ncbi:MAG: hypothetical protein OQK50_03450 [Deltaproteobacteria bacterium]|nr:hypothetical protein [Deltaproteobacteria bacterium]MCW8893388.1 hypothetical protein [Deltaproteobacteria bacterium]MCW9049370.1 hypothetical protein [Deltaproteobacteria bacterium]
MAVKEISLDFYSEPVDLYCPVCGATLFARGIRAESCPHLLFWGG